MAIHHSDDSCDAKKLWSLARHTPIAVLHRYAVSLHGPWVVDRVHPMYWHSTPARNWAWDGHMWIEFPASIQWSLTILQQWWPISALRARDQGDWVAQHSHAIYLGTRCGGTSASVQWHWEPYLRWWTSTHQTLPSPLETLGAIIDHLPVWHPETRTVTWKDWDPVHVPEGITSITVLPSRSGTWTQEEFGP